MITATFPPAARFTQHLPPRFPAAVTLFGRRFDTIAFRDQDDANIFMLCHPAFGLLHVADSLYHVALMTDQGETA